MTESPRDKTGRKPDGRFPTGDKRPDASPTQTTRIADARKHIADRPKRIEVAIRMDGKVALTHAPHRDDAGWQQHLLDAFGTTSQDFASTGLNLVTEAQRCASETEASVSRVNAALAAIDGTQPADEMSAMLASQMVVTHALAMDFLVSRRSDCDGLVDAENGQLLWRDEQLDAARDAGLLVDQAELVEGLEHLVN